MNFESITNIVSSLFGIKKGSRNLLNKVLKNKAKAKEYALKQCESNYVTREDIERGLEILNGSHNKEHKKITLTKYSEEEINKRRQLHNKAKEVFAEAASTHFVKNELMSQLDGYTRDIFSIVRNMSPSPEKEIEIINTLNEFKNTKDEQAKANCRAQIKEFFTNSLKKCKETLESFNSVGSDEELIEFYKKNWNVLNTTIELQSSDNGKNHYFKKIEKAFGFEFDNNLAEEYGKKYSDFGVEATMICAKVHGMANPLYPEINYSEISPVLRLFVDPPVDIPFNSQIGNYLTKITRPDTESKSKDLLNPLNSYSKASTTLSPTQEQEFLYGKDVDSELLYMNQIDRLKTHLTFTLNARGYEGKAEDFEYYDKEGKMVQPKDAFIRMAKGESLLVADKVSSNFIMEAASDPNNSFGFVNNNNEFKTPKTNEAENIVNENNKLLKELETAKYKKDHAWFKFTRNRYQKQIDELGTKISTFKKQYNLAFNSSMTKGINEIVDKVNENTLVNDPDKKLYDKFKLEVNNLAAANPSNKVQFQKQLEAVNKAASNYISAKIEDGSFSKDEDFKNRISLISNVKEACFNFKNLSNEHESIFKENVEKINEVQPGLLEKVSSNNGPEHIVVSELDEDIFFDPEEPIKEEKDKHKEISID